MGLRKSIRKRLGFLGIDNAPIKHHPSALAYFNCDLLLDVGANIGQYALETRRQGYSGKIVSFEPLSSAHSTLKHNARADDRWLVHERCAVGEKPGKMEINISQNSYSSSMLPMLPSHSDAAPQSLYVGNELTEVITLDSVFSHYRSEKEKVFLKIDTQGYEKQVLDGTSKCMQYIDVVQLELSLVPLYDTQELYEYFFSRFKNMGFELWSLFPEFINPDTGQLLQFDAIFVRC